MSGALASPHFPKPFLLCVPGEATTPPAGRTDRTATETGTLGQTSHLWILIIIHAISQNTRFCNFDMPSKSKYVFACVSV